MNYLFSKSTFRGIFRNKYNWINIFGLTVSTSVFLTIFLFIQNEYSYEKHHENLNNIFRIEQLQKFGETRNMCGAPPPLSLVITEDIPEIQLSTRYV
jgi:putative ABC transport system permease protein